MVDSLLSFARVVTHGKENVSLNKITHNALDLLAVKATKYGVKIKHDLDEKLITVYADENKLLQVILNLITNAIESCEENSGGNIIVKTFLVESDESKNIYWTIEDDGIGISEEDQKKIFEDFYTSKENGTGLGLSVCKMLANEQHAEINFESKLGVGTKFQMIFDVNRMRKLYEAENSGNR
jgi:signal transduction histidine kinase